MGGRRNFKVLTLIISEAYNIICYDCEKGNVR